MIYTDDKIEGTAEHPYRSNHFGVSHSCYCDAESCRECKHTVTFGEKVYCGHTSQRCTLWDVIRAARNYENNVSCCWCKHCHKSITSDKCSECLSSDHLKNFQYCDDYYEIMEKWNATHPKVEE